MEYYESYLALRNDANANFISGRTDSPIDALIVNTALSKRTQQRGDKSGIYYLDDVFQYDDDDDLIDVISSVDRGILEFFESQLANYINRALRSRIRGFYITDFVGGYRDLCSDTLFEPFMNRLKLKNIFALTKKVRKEFIDGEKAPSLEEYCGENVPTDNINVAIFFFQIKAIYMHPKLFSNLEKQLETGNVYRVSDDIRIYNEIIRFISQSSDLLIISGDSCYYVSYTHYKNKGDYYFGIRKINPLDLWSTTIITPWK